MMSDNKMWLTSINYYLRVIAMDKKKTDGISTRSVSDKNLPTEKKSRREEFRDDHIIDDDADFEVRVKLRKKLLESSDLSVEYKRLMVKASGKLLEGVSDKEHNEISEKIKKIRKELDGLYDSI